MAALNLSKRSICETCGHQGWKNSLVTCSKCRIACEHCYCMRESSFETSIHFVCADCSMRPVQNKFTSDSIKGVPRSIRNKVRVESSNPVPKWKKIPETSRMKLISPEEVKKLACGGSTSKPTFRVPRPVSARPPMGLTKPTAGFPRARSLNSTVVARKTKSIYLPPKKVEPLSPRTQQIRPGVMRQASKAQAVGEGSKSKVGDGAKYHDSNEICRSILSEKLLQLLPYRPALHPIWKGRIVDSATPSEFNGEFLAQPASKVRGKAYILSKAIPVLLKVKLVPIGNLLSGLFMNRKPGLSDVEMYIFPDDKNTKRFTAERDHIFEAMRIRNAMMKFNINGTPLLIFSSKLLDKSSQIIIKMQKKTNNFLWGIFLLTKKSLALLPGTSNQTPQHFDDGYVVDNDTEPFFRRYHRNCGKQLQRHYGQRD
ncbi:unnamed protein product [Arabidopsis thaliana]|uniref:PHD finger-containing protein 6 n=2 Tax=Arabidopsis thaliana TaxID=3702 RepID=PHD6_ARATH|nr:zinc ion-binding protein [Arabidopsis thaliana]F4K200.1 RecName: Full=PHD finger-containing protein 6 [Arabidopsis thaliana]AED97423.1 zinc ion-binding protein [Arabidopsis thaliana]CAD5335498.1 unnamed protein product [Arabidopsis thaliana]|eukprot:NP_200920.3 zinc ion-binding protein [Arabidopsis thaliana]